MQNDFLQLNKKNKTFPIKNLLSFGTAVLRKKKILKPRHEARLLMSKELESNELFITLHDNLEISKEKKVFFLKNIYKRYCGKPISRIFGKREFYSRDFFINKFTLDPRPESEFLVDICLELISRIKKNNISVLDLGTGSGCLIISIILEAQKKLKKIINASGVDYCEKSVEVAKKNKKRFSLGDNLKFYKSDWFSNIKNKFDIIISNPPYIKSDDIEVLPDTVKIYDPLLALDGGVNGLDSYQNIQKDVDKYLNNFGFLCLEIGDDQNEAVKKVFTNNSLRLHNQYSDYSGVVRNVVFQLGKKDLKK